MIKKSNRAICFVLCILLAISLLGCGRQPRGGLGKLTLGNKGTEATAEPTQSSEPNAPVPPMPNDEPVPVPQPSEPTEPNEPTEPIASGYCALSCPDQGFAILVNDSYSTSSGKDGASIYPQSYGKVPYVKISSYQDMGITVADYFDLCIESNTDYYGSDMHSVSDVKTYTFGNKQIQGVEFDYSAEGARLMMYCMAELVGSRLNVFITKVVHSDEQYAQLTAEALSIAVQSIQLDADFYSNASSGSSDPAPSEPAGTIATEPYSNDLFKMDKPVGWQVNYDVIKADNGQGNLYIFVTDPSNPNNAFFFIQQLSCFFPSQKAKQAYLPYLPAYYKDAPVLNEPTAAETLRQWHGLYSVLANEGLIAQHIRDYQLEELVQEQEIYRHDSDGICQTVAAGIISIPQDSGIYVMLFENTLKMSSAPEGFNLPDMLISYRNYGWVLNSEQGDMIDTLSHCIGSIDFSQYTNIYGPIMGNGFANNNGSLTAGGDWGSFGVGDDSSHTFGQGIDIKSLFN